MSNKTRPLWVSHGAAVLAVVVATAIRLLLDPWLGERFPFATLLLAVVVAAWFGGFRPAITATLAGGIAALVFLLPPREAVILPAFVNQTGLVLYLLAGFGISILGGSMQAARARAEAHAEELQDEVRQRRQTERELQQSQQHLRQQREQLRITLTSIGDAVIATDPQGHVTFLNPIAQNLTGWTQEEAEGVSLAEVFKIVNEQTRITVESPVDKVLRVGGIVGLANHTVLIAKDGTERPIEDSAAPIRDETENLSGVVLVFRDASGKRSLEIEQGRLVALVESSDDAIIGQTIEGVVTEWNAGAQRLFGYSAEEVIGRSMLETIVPPDRKDELLEALQRVKQGKRAEQFETVRQCKNERRIHVAVRISPILNMAGDVIGASAIDRDISQPKAAEKRRNARLAVTQILAQEQDAANAITDILAAVCSALGWNAGCFWQLKPDEDVLRCQEFWQEPGRNLEEFRSAAMRLALKRGNSLPGRVWKSGEPIWIRDVVVDPDFIRAPQAKDVDLHGGFACPVAVGEEFLGVVEWFSHEIQQPDDDLLEMMATIGGQIGQFIERKNSERAVKESERLYRAIGESIDYGVWVCDAEGRNTYVSDSFLRLTGLTQERCSEFGWGSVLHPDDAEQTMAAWKECVRTGSQWDIEHRFKGADGEYHPILARGVPVKDEEGRIVCWAGINLDISRMKQAEENLKRHSERLTLLWEAAAVLLTAGDPDAMMRGLFAQISDHLGVDACFSFVVDETGEALRLVSCIGIPEEMAQPMQRLEFGQALPGTVALQRQPIIATQIQESDDPKVGLIKGLGIRAYACNPLMADEQLIGTLSFASHSKDHFDEGELSFMETLCHYVTFAYVRLRLVEQLQETDRRKDEFLATLAHELRNPLAPIRHGLQVIRLAGEDKHTVEQVHSMMERQLEQMVRLIDDLLDVSRITRNKLELRKEVVELKPVIQSAIESVQPLIEDCGHALTVTLPSEAVPLDADPTRLAQVFSNLLTNAAKYTEHGGHIWLTAERQGSDAVVSVRDTGIGIAAEHLPSLFQMFSQAAPALERSQSGLGIGLALVRGLVEMHGGSIEARSDGLGEGSEFVVRLPVLIASKKANDVARSPEEFVASKRRILVVDDNKAAAQMLALTLRLQGHEVQTAHDGLEAVERAATHQPDVILLDIGLPKLNGYDACRRIREQSGGDKFTIVALTGWGQEEDKRKAMEAGFDHHFTKPMDAGALGPILAKPEDTVGS